MPGFISTEEWYPVFCLTTYGYRNIPAGEFTDVELSDLQRVEAEFSAWQRKLAERIGRQPNEYCQLIITDRP